MPVHLACAQGWPAAGVILPPAGAMVNPTQAFVPVIVKGLTIFPENPLEFNFIIDTGHSKLEEAALKEETTKLIKYFLATLTIPEDDVWVNLSPYEKDRIIPEKFGLTDMGKDLLAQDYLLKQLTASLMYPEDELGKKFWDRVYKKARAQYGTTEIPLNTFNKVWIVPEKAVIYEHENNAFILESHLKVMLEEDYLALQQNAGNEELAMNTLSEDETQEASKITSDIVKEVLIPEIEKEVNEGKTFANLRQIYHSMILATWYKEKLKNSLLAQVYADKSKIKGIDVEDKNIKEKIYNQYLEAFKKGVYDYIKEDYDPATKEIIPRKYFSGGFRTKGADGRTLKSLVITAVVSAATLLSPSQNGAIAAAEDPVGQFETATWMPVDIGTQPANIAEGLAQLNQSLADHRVELVQADPAALGEIIAVDPRTLLTRLMEKSEALEEEVQRVTGLNVVSSIYHAGSLTGNQKDLTQEEFKTFLSGARFMLPEVSAIQIDLTEGAMVRIELNGTQGEMGQRRDRIGVHITPGRLSAESAQRLRESVLNFIGWEVEVVTNPLKITRLREYVSELKGRFEGIVEFIQKNDQTAEQNFVNDPALRARLALKLRELIKWVREDIADADGKNSLVDKLKQTLTLGYLITKDGVDIGNPYDFVNKLVPTYDRLEQNNVPAERIRDTVSSIQRFLETILGILPYLESADAVRVLTHKDGYQFVDPRPGGDSAALGDLSPQEQRLIIAMVVVMRDEKRIAQMANLLLAPPSSMPENISPEIIARYLELRRSDLEKFRRIHGKLASEVEGLDQRKYEQYFGHYSTSPVMTTLVNKEAELEEIVREEMPGLDPNKLFTQEQEEFERYQTKWIVLEGLNGQWLVDTLWVPGKRVNDAVRAQRFQTRYQALSEAREIAKRYPAEVRVPGDQDKQGPAVINDDKGRAAALRDVLKEMQDAISRFGQFNNDDREVATRFLGKVEKNPRIQDMVLEARARNILLLSSNPDVDAGRIEGVMMAIREIPEDLLKKAGSPVNFDMAKSQRLGGADGLMVIEDTHAGGAMAMTQMEGRGGSEIAATIIHEIVGHKLSTIWRGDGRLIVSPETWRRIAGVLEISLDHLASANEKTFISYIRDLRNPGMRRLNEAVAHAVENNSEQRFIGQYQLTAAQISSVRSILRESLMLSAQPIDAANNIYQGFEFDGKEWSAYYLRNQGGRWTTAAKPAGTAMKGGDPAAIGTLSSLGVMTLDSVQNKKFRPDVEYPTSGRKIEGQQDRFLNQLIEIQGVPHGYGSLTVILDGNGGHAVAHFAQQKILEIFTRFLRETNGDVTQAQSKTIEELQRLLREDESIKDFAKDQGSTIVMGYLSYDNAREYTATLGDSWIVIGNAQSKKWVSQVHNQRTMIMVEGEEAILAMNGVLGYTEEQNLERKPYLDDQPLEEGDFILTFSDGLVDAPGRTIEEVIDENVALVQGNSQIGAKNLVQEALKRGTRDNVTVSLHRQTAAAQKPSKAKTITSKNAATAWSLLQSLNSYLVGVSFRTADLTEAEVKITENLIVETNERQIVVGYGMIGNETRIFSSPLTGNKVTVKYDGGYGLWLEDTSALILQVPGTGGGMFRIQQKPSKDPRNPQFEITRLGGAPLESSDPAAIGDLSSQVNLVFAENGRFDRTGQPIVVVVEDDPDFQKELGKFLPKKFGLQGISAQIVVVPYYNSALQAIMTARGTGIQGGQDLLSLVISDGNYPDGKGIDEKAGDIKRQAPRLLNFLKGFAPAVPMIVLSSEEKAVIFKETEINLDEIHFVDKSQVLRDLMPLVNQLLNQNNREPSKQNPGGISLNAKLLDMQIKRDGNGVPLPLPQQPIQTMRIEGFIPVIINITPTTNLPFLLGVAPQQDPSDTSQNSDTGDHSNPLALATREEL